MKTALKLLCTVVGLVTIPALQAQVQRLDEVRLPVKIQVDIGSQGLQLNWQPLADQPGNDYLVIERLSLAEGDLILDYRLYEPPEKDFFYNISLALDLDGGLRLEPKTVKLQGDFGRISDLSDSEKKLVWMDILESAINPGFSYTLMVTVHLMGDPGLDCSLDRPVFSTAQQLPYYAGAVAGLALIGLGELMHDDANTAYEDYQQLWQNNATKELADPTLQNAKKERENAKTLGYIGLGVLIVDAALVTRKILKTRKKQRRYDRYCRDESTQLSFRPFHQLRSGYGNAAAVGLSMNLKF